MNNSGSKGQLDNKISYSPSYQDYIQADIFGRIGNIAIDIPDVFDILVNTEGFLVGDLKHHSKLLLNLVDKYHPNVEQVIRNFTNQFFILEYEDAIKVKNKNACQDAEYLLCTEDDLLCTENDLLMTSSNGEITNF